MYMHIHVYMYMYNVSPVLAACACSMHSACLSHHTWLVGNCARVQMANLSKSDSEYSEIALFFGLEKLGSVSCRE